MRVLIAPDKFKGSLAARDVAEYVAIGIRDVLPKAEIDIVPVADGGEGTADVIRSARGGEWIACKAHDAIGTMIDARYVWIADHRVAIIDMSEAAGISRIAPAARDPARANTFGVGEMILAAAARGAEQIIIGLGGSATNDGGFGMARALGFCFVDHNGNELNGGPGDLARLARIERPRDLVVPPIRAAFDVRNPLLGARGATRTFAAQKGATAEQLENLERGLARLAEVAARDLHRNCRETPGSGAAGGLGYGLATFCHATLTSGFEVVADAIDLDAHVESADVVITGEGKLDATTREGKAPAGMALLARKHHKRVFAIVGCAEDDGRDLFDEVFALARPPITQTLAIKLTAELLRERARELAQRYVVRV